MVKHYELVGNRNLVSSCGMMIRLLDYVCVWMRVILRGGDNGEVIVDKFDVNRGWVVGSRRTK